MRLLVTVVDPATEPPVCQDVLIDAGAGATLGDVCDDLCRQVGVAGPGAGFRVGGQRLDLAHPLGEPPLLRGAVLTADRHTARGMPLTSAAVIHLEWVAGPSAGHVVALERGRHVLGRGAGCAVRLEDGAVSRRHLELAVTPAGVMVRDLSPTNRSTLNGTPLDGAAAVMCSGDRLRLGSTTLTHRISAMTPAATTLVDGLRRVHRPPRFRVDPAAPEVAFPRPPSGPERNRLPLVAALVPMMLSTLLAIVLRSPVMLLFALLTPVMLVGQWWSDRRHGRISHRRRLAEHGRERRQAEKALVSALEREYRQRHEEAPDLAAVTHLVGGVGGAGGVGARLWERRPEDADHLAVRVGLAPQPPRTRVVGDQSDLPALPALEVPAVLRLPAVGVLGVAGPRERGLALVRGLVGQICVWHSPRDVRLVVLTADPGGADDWAWAPLLPHLAPLTPTCLASVGDLAHSGSVTRRVTELAELVARRREAAGRSRFGADLVVVLDGPALLRSEPGVADLLRGGPPVGVYFICLDRDVTRLPVEATAQIVLDAGPAARGRLDLAGGAIATLLPDLPPRTWAETLARSLAPLEDATPAEEGQALPDRVDFVEVHRRRAESGDPLDPVAVARRWSAADHRPIAVLGQGHDGPVVLDLVRDGPHALVGGTTGAGKSELLQTLVGSLALHSRPDELTFVLIDYKGGSALRDCSGLPHVLGVVTDLDKHLTARALTSLGAEIKRRERILAEVGAKDLEDYRGLARPHADPLPRLVLVVDEFRVLADELPDFVGGLVRLAAVGRSLGVHLVLATQRPAGIVSADMRANVSLRIALRVRDRPDSDDLIEAPEAARIPDWLPGRAYIRAGSHRLVPVQVAFAGSPPAASASSLTRPVLRGLQWADVMAPPSEDRARPTCATGPTTLRALCQTLAETARALYLHRPTSPWLPPLPALVAAGDDRLVGPEGARRAVPLGLVDRPAEQRQTALSWDLAHDGHLGIGGGARTGRTTAVLSIALRLAERFPPSQLHLHALESTPGSLACLSALPQAGSVTGTDDPQRLRRAVRRLCETRQDAERRTVVLIDGWESITEALDDLDQGESTERLLGLVRDGLSRGIHVVVTGGRAVASGRLASLLQRRLLLDMPDPVDLTLAGISPGTANRHRTPGRALDVRDEAEVQLSLPGDDLGADHRALAEAVAAAVTQRHGPAPPNLRPWRLLPLPEHVPLGGLTGPAGQLLIGLGGDEGEPLGFDLSRDERRVLVLGSPRCGKSTLLQTLARQLLSAGCEVAILAPRRSPLSRMPRRPDLHLLGPDDHDRFVALRRERPDLAVLVDDGDRLDGSALESGLVETARLVENAAGFIAVALDARRAATAFRGLVPEVGRAGVGVILCPTSPTDGDLLRVRVETQPARIPGRGVLVTDGRAVPIQVAVDTSG